MRFIDNLGNTDPTINLALEEYVLREFPLDEPYLLFYINEPSVIIGKNQNTVEEIHQGFIEEQGIHVVRRLSGGGAVYHDLGNLNFSFLTKDDGESFHNFQKFTKPVIDALKELGVNAELSGRNDILVEGRKVSGNAQFTTNGRMFSHGTLLFNVKMDQVANALNVKLDKIQSKGVKSVRGRVANITEFLSEPMTMNSFKAHLLRSIFGQAGPLPVYHLTDAQWDDVYALAEKRYRSWDWNYGKSLSADVENAFRFPAGQIDVRLKLDKGVIQACKIFGDFFGMGDVKEVEELLIGCPYTKGEITNRLSDVNIAYYFGNVSLEEFMQVFFEGAAV